MTASFTVTKKQNVTLGNKIGVTGIYTSAGGGTGGDIKTGLVVVDAIFLSPKGSAVTNVPVVNETLPLKNTDGTVTIVTGANEIGSFLAIGS